MVVDSTELGSAGKSYSEDCVRKIFLDLQRVILKKEWDTF